MAVERITKRLVDAAKPNERDTFIWDADVRGFGLKVTPSGKETYVVQYRIPGVGRSGFAKRMVLGDHGVLTPEEARKRAREELGNVARGLDPAAERVDRKGAATVKDLGVAFLAD